MAKIKIVTDSTCGKNPELKDFDVTIVPLSVMVDGVVYMTDENFSDISYMKMMKNAKSLPKTSQPAIGVFAKVFEELTADGSIVLSIHCTKNLSGTVESARQASRLVKGEVHVVDSGFIDQGLSHQVIKAAEMAATNNYSVDEIIEEINKIKENERLFIGVSTLENLVKGGRVSKAKGLVSSILNIKVLFELTKDGLQPVQKGRGTKVFFKWLGDLKEELRGKNIIKLGISYAGLAELAENIKKEIQDEFPHLNIQILHTSPAVSTHTGEGAFAVMYYTL